VRLLCCRRRRRRRKRTRTMTIRTTISISDFVLLPTDPEFTLERVGVLRAR
jgi:hypothetical protein